MLNVELSVMQVVGSFSTRFGILVCGAEEAYHFQPHASGWFLMLHTIWYFGVWCRRGLSLSVSYDGVSCKFPMQEHEYCSRTILQKERTANGNSASSQQDYLHLHQH